MRHHQLLIDLSDQHLVAAVSVMPCRGSSGLLTVTHTMLDGHISCYSLAAYAVPGLVSAVKGAEEAQVLQLQGHCAKVTCSLEVLYQVPLPPDVASPPHYHPAAPTPCEVVLLVTGSADGSVRAWHWEQDNLGQPFMAAHPHTGEVAGLLLPPPDAAGPWCGCLVSVSLDGTVALLSLQQRACLRVFRGYPHGLPLHVAWNVRRGFLVSAGLDMAGQNACWVWDVSSGELDRVLVGQQGRALLDLCAAQGCLIGRATAGAAAAGAMSDVGPAPSPAQLASLESPRVLRMLHDPSSSHLRYLPCTRPNIALVIINGLPLISSAPQQPTTPTTPRSFSATNDVSDAVASITALSLLHKWGVEPPADIALMDLLRSQQLMSLGERERGAGTSGRSSLSRDEGQDEVKGRDWKLAVAARSSNTSEPDVRAGTALGSQDVRGERGGGWVDGRRVSEPGEGWGGTAPTTCLVIEAMIADNSAVTLGVPFMSGWPCFLQAGGRPAAATAQQPQQPAKGPTGRVTVPSSFAGQGGDASRHQDSAAGLPVPAPAGTQNIPLTLAPRTSPLPSPPSRPEYPAPTPTHPTTQSLPRPSRPSSPPPSLLTLQSRAPLALLLGAWWRCSSAVVSWRLLLVMGLARSLLQRRPAAAGDRCPAVAASALSQLYMVTLHNQAGVMPPNLVTFACLWLHPCTTLREAAQLLLCVYTEPDSSADKDGPGLPAQVLWLQNSYRSRSGLSKDQLLASMPRVIVCAAACLNHTARVPQSLLATAAACLTDVLRSALPPPLPSVAAGARGGPDQDLAAAVGPAAAAALLTAALHGSHAATWRAALCPWQDFLALVVALVYTRPMPGVASRVLQAFMQQSPQPPPLTTLPPSRSSIDNLDLSSRFRPLDDTHMAVGLPAFERDFSIISRVQDGGAGAAAVLPATLALPPRPCSPHSPPSHTHRPLSHSSTPGASSEALVRLGSGGAGSGTDSPGNDRDDRRLWQEAAGASAGPPAAAAGNGSGGAPAAGGVVKGFRGAGGGGGSNGSDERLLDSELEYGSMDLLSQQLVQLAAAVAAQDLAGVLSRLAARLSSPDSCYLHPLMLRALRQLLSTFNGRQVAGQALSSLVPLLAHTLSSPVTAALPQLASPCAAFVRELCDTFPAIACHHATNQVAVAAVVAAGEAPQVVVLSLQSGVKLATCRINSAALSAALQAQVSSLKLGALSFHPNGHHMAGMFYGAAAMLLLLWDVSPRWLAAPLQKLLPGPKAPPSIPHSSAVPCPQVSCSAADLQRLRIEWGGHGWVEVRQNNQVVVRTCVA